MQKTISEQLFENYLHKNKIKFEPVPCSKERTPDYLVDLVQGQIAFEVTELTKWTSVPANVGLDIRDKISEKKKQLQWASRRNLPAVLVIYNNFDPLQLRGTEQHDFLAAMFGDLTL